MIITIMCKSDTCDALLLDPAQVACSNANLSLSTTGAHAGRRSPLSLLCNAGAAIHIAAGRSAHVLLAM